MDKLNEWLTSVEQKTELLILRMEEYKKEISKLKYENQLLNDQIAHFSAESKSDNNVVNIANQNFAKADTESIKKKIDGIVEEIDQALAVLTN
jgi:hypothetical protein